MDLTDEIKIYILKSDQRNNKIQGWDANEISSYINKLFEFKTIEVGYRSQCGSTHKGQKTFNEVVRIIYKLKKEGFKIEEETVKHKNAYATNNGGFWNSKIFTLIV